MAEQQHAQSSDDDHIEFTHLKIDDYAFNVNRDENGIIMITTFDDLIPLFNENIGPHFKIQNRKEVKIVPFNGNIAENLIIPNEKEMEDEEYFTEFCKRKKEFIEHLISRTYSKGFERPSAVQSLSIMELVLGRDALVQSKSGTGKTHAFLTGCLWHFDPSSNVLQHLFITNSHEVASQIYEQAKYLLPDETRIELCIGAKSASASNGGFKTPISTSCLLKRPKTLSQMKKDIMNAQVIVCTMGKIFDILFNKKFINLKYLKTICIDEFDNIVASRSRSRSSSIMSTEQQMAEIIGTLPNHTQRIFYSATVSHDSLEIARGYFRPYQKNVGEPFMVLLDTTDYTLEGINQFYVPCEGYKDKILILLDLLKQLRISQAIIFVNRTDTAMDVKAFLDDNQDIPITSAVFHGNLISDERKAVHKSFKENKIRLLISTDLTARGLDIQGINLVINFDMPNSLETYVHRVGRSGRYGRKGVAISFIVTNNTYDEKQKIVEINERSKKSPMMHLPENLDELL